MTESVSDLDLLAHTSDIITAYVSNNAISTDDLPGLMNSVHEKMKSIAVGIEERPKPKPPVPINKSIQHDHIVCLEDGKKLKMLKRYLRTRYNLTPEEYRSRWNLPADYPMVAPEYAERRSNFAKEIGLGKKPR